MSEPSTLHPACLVVDKLRELCDSERLRRSGPGGQHRNKVETAVRLTHRPTGVAAEASERRSQAQNLAVAEQRLRVKLAIEVRTPASPAPSELWNARRRGQRIEVNPQHQDFPALLAEALNVLADEQWDDRRAAERLGLSRTQLVKFLKLEPAALAMLNHERAAAGFSELR